MDNKSNRRILAILFTGVLMGALDISIVGPAIPSIEDKLSIEPRMLGWIFSIYVLFNLSGVSLFARLSDIFGRRNIYIVSLGIFALGSLVVSLSHNLTSLLIGRAVQGFGASGIFPVASAVVGDIFPPEKRGRVLGLIGAVFGLAFLIGPIIAGILLKYFEWSVLFLINIPIAIVLILVSIRNIPQTRVETSSLFDWKGILSLGLMLAAFTFGINHIDSADFTGSLLSVMVLPFLIGAFLLMITTFLIEKNAENPIIKLSYFRNRQIMIAGTIAIATGILQSSFVFIPNFVVGAFKMAPSEASFMLVPLVLATAIGSPLFGRLIDLYGSKIMILIALVLSGAGFYFLHLSVESKILFYVSAALIGFGLSVLSGSSLRYIMLNETSVVDRAVTQGMLTIFISLGQLTGASLIGVIIAHKAGTEGYVNVFLYQSMFLILIIISAFFLKNRKSEFKPG
jgi:multidrug resistance protein